MPKDAIAGLLTAGIGLNFAVVAQRYGLGTTADMGAGYFPFWVGVLTVILGLSIALKSLFERDASRFAVPKAREILIVVCILAPVGLFGYALERFGMILSVMVVVLVSGFANRPLRIVPLICTAVILAGLCVAIFIVGLNMQVSVWPSLS